MPELGRQQLAGARAAALGEELLVDAVVHQLPHVGLEGRGVDPVALERAPEEERAAAPQDSGPSGKNERLAPAATSGTA